MKDTKLSHFEIEIPETLIAKKPTTFRDESRLMVLHRSTGEIEHRHFKDILDYFSKDDVFVFNDTKVFPARMYGIRRRPALRSRSSSCANSTPPSSSGTSSSTRS